MSASWLLSWNPKHPKPCELRAQSELLNSIGTIITNFIIHGITYASRQHSSCFWKRLWSSPGVRTAWYLWQRSQPMTTWELLETPPTRLWLPVQMPHHPKDVTPKSVIDSGTVWNTNGMSTLQFWIHATELDIQPIWIPSPRKPGTLEGWNMSKHLLDLEIYICMLISTSKICVFNCCYSFSWGKWLRINQEKYENTEKKTGETIVLGYMI